MKQAMAQTCLVCGRWIGYRSSGAKECSQCLDWALAVMVALWRKR